MNGRVGAEPAGLVSFDVFYAAELSYLLALAVALLTSREAARDIVQETLLRAYRDWPQVLEVSAGTVTKSLFMARQTLAARLLAEEDGSDDR